MSNTGAAEGITQAGGAQLSFLVDQIDRMKRFFEARRNFNRSMAFFFTLTVSLLSAIATVSIGLSEKLGPKWLLAIAMIASGLSTVLGAWQALFNNRKLWSINNMALSELYVLESDISFRGHAAAADPILDAEVEEFYARYKAILAKAEKAWESVNTA
jgi:hypothetical protein